MGFPAAGVAGTFGFGFCFSALDAWPPNMRSKTLDWGFDADSGGESSWPRHAVVANVAQQAMNKIHAHTISILKLVE